MTKFREQTIIPQMVHPKINGEVLYPFGPPIYRCEMDNEIIDMLKSGKAIRFEEAKTKPMGRSASGVRGIRLQHDKDEVIGMVSVNDMESNILVVSSNGYGKRSKLEDYRITNRGGKGVKTISITDKTGSLVSIKNVNDTNGLMIINKSGIAIRMAVKDLRVMGRATQGVKLINIKKGDSIAAVAKVIHEEQDEQEDAVVETENTASSEAENVIKSNKNISLEITNEEENTEE